MNPRISQEKELFQVVVHASQFTVSARRVHQILHPHQPYESWMQVSILRAVLEEGTDYWYREKMHHMPKRRHHGIVFNLYAILKVCTLYASDADATEEQERAAKQLFKAVGTKQQELLQTCMGYIGSYWVYQLPWRQLGKQRIYPLKKVLKSIDLVPAFELTVRQQFPQHIIPHRGQPFISNGLVQLLHMKQWLAQYRQAIAAEQPFANVQA